MLKKSWNEGAIGSYGPQNITSWRPVGLDVSVGDFASILNGPTTAHQNCLEQGEGGGGKHDYMHTHTIRIIRRTPRNYINPAQHSVCASTMDAGI